MIKVVINRAAFEFQKYDQRRNILESVFEMEENYIVPFATDWFTTTSGNSISSQKLYKYDEFFLSRYNSEMDITEIRTEIADLTLAFTENTRGNKSQWYTSGDSIDNLASGYYSIEFVDNAGTIFTTYPFRVCAEAVPLVETNYIIENDEGVILTDGVDLLIWQ